MVVPVPQDHILTLNGQLTYNFILTDVWDDVPDGRIEVSVSVELHFPRDYSYAMVGSGWPTIRFDNALPLNPRTHGVTISRVDNQRGSYDLASGHLDMPVVLHVAFEPLPTLGGIWDQDIVVPMTTREFNGLNLWSGVNPPRLDLRLHTPVRFTTRHFFAGKGHGHTIDVILRGVLSPLPPRSLPVPAPAPVESAECRTLREQLLDARVELNGFEDALAQGDFDDHSSSDQAEIARLQAEIDAARARVQALDQAGISAGCW